MATSEFVKAIAEKLKTLYDLLALNIERIAALPDRDSEIIGRLLAKNLNIEFGLYLDAEMTKNAFIVASDSALFDDYCELGTAAFGNITFAFWQNWLSASYVCPDIIGIMAQSCVFPWNEGIQAMDTDRPLFGLLTPDDRSPEVIAQAILRSESQPTKFEPGFYAERKSLLKGIGAQSGRHRYNFMTESPVPGSWFAPD